MKGDLVEDVKERLSIEEVIGDYLELRRSGRNFKGLSPFNPEKTPSLMVSPEKQIWHDFSSGRGGTMFGFVMEMEGIGFREALELLARKAGLDIGQYRHSGGNEKRKQRIHQVLEQAARFYQAQLVYNAAALAYVTQKRGFNRQSVADFRLGYAPKDGHSLLTFLQSKNFSVREIQEAGLATQRRGGLGDMFRGRMMVALQDTQGQVIGFTARSIDPNDTGPKYINTPQTLVYDKSRHVYGFSQAKDAIRRAGFAVVVEGNLDVITSHQAGVKNVVATAGTAMTIQHLKIVGRLASDIRLCFDVDDAGLRATERVVALAQELDVQLSIVTITDGKDPDDLIRQDAAKWPAVISTYEYAVDWLYNRYKQKLDLTTARDKRAFSLLILELITNLKDKIEQDHYLRQLARDTDVSLEAVKFKQRTFKNPQKYKKPKNDLSKLTPVDTTKLTEDKLLGLLLLYPTARRALLAGELALEFSGDEPQQVYKFLVDHPQTVVDDASLPEGLQSVANYVKMILFSAEHYYQDFASNERLREVNELANKLIKTSQKSQKHILIQQLRQAEAAGEDQLVAELIGKIDALNK